MDAANETSCIPTLQKLESYSTELLKLSLQVRGVEYDDDYDRYDLLALLLLSMRIDCPHYTKKEIEDINKGKKVKYHGKESDPPSVRQLLPLQRKHVDKMIKILHKYATALNMCDPGTGKTLMDLCTCLLLGKKAYIITQSYILASYISLAKKFGLYDIIIGMSSYSLAIRAKEYDIHTYNEEDPDKSIIQSKYIIRTKTTRMGKRRDEIAWKDAKDIVVIFDEPHHAKNKISYAHALLENCYTYITTYPGRKNKMILSGATPSDKLETINYITYVLGLTDRNGKDIEGFKFSDIPGRNYFLKLNYILFNKANPRASRISRDELEEELGVSFSVTVTIKAFKVSKEAEKVIEQNNQYIADLLEGIIRKPQATIFQEIMKSNQIIELEKVPTLLDLVNEGLDKEERILIFVRFYNTSNALYDVLKQYKAVLLTGETKKRYRNKIMKDFREGKIPILITHHDIASEGVSLHSLVLNYDSLVLITPVWSGITMRQVLDRTNRLCRLSKTRQIIVYARSSDPNKRSWDERISQVMVGKLKNIKQLSTGESGDEFTGELYKEANKITDIKTSTTLVLAGKRYE